jgi:hypothetical protein
MYEMTCIILEFRLIINVYYLPPCMYGLVLKSKKKAETYNGHESTEGTVK